MKRLPSRMMIAATILILSLVPAYAHHGNQFLSKATEMIAAEVRFGEIATHKTHNTEVKGLAEMLVADHNEVLRKLMELRAARTTVRATPAAAAGFIAQSGWGTER